MKTNTFPIDEIINAGKIIVKENIIPTEWEYNERIDYRNCFAQFGSIEDYTALNNAIGKAKSYPDEKSDTFFYSDPNPTAVDGLYYMQITAEVQERWPQVLQDVELIECKPGVQNQDE